MARQLLTAWHLRPLKLGRFQSVARSGQSKLGNSSAPFLYVGVCRTNGAIILLFWVDR